MAFALLHPISIGIAEIRRKTIWSSLCSSRPDSRVFAVSLSTSAAAAADFVPPAPIFLPEGPWKLVPGGVTAAKGFKAAGMYGGLRAKGQKPDLALVTCDVDAVAAGSFTTNIVAAAPVVYCRHILDISTTARAVLINAGQANAATGDAGYQDVIECASAIAKLLQLRAEEVLIESTGVIGRRIKKEALLNSLPKLVSLLSPTVEGADSAAMAITTTDLVSKSVAIESKVGGVDIRVGGMAKGSGMIHPNMATMLGVITTDATVTGDIWRKMVQIAVNRSFNQITVDGDTSTNDTVIALASGISGSTRISSLDSDEAQQLQACLDAVMQGLAKSIAWDGEGATCLIEVKYKDLLHFSKWKITQLMFIQLWSSWILIIFNDDCKSATIEQNHETCPKAFPEIISRLVHWKLSIYKQPLFDSLLGLGTWFKNSVESTQIQHLTSEARLPTYLPWKV